MTLQYLLCEECGHSRFRASTKGSHCLYCGSERMIIGSQPPAVVKYEEQR